MKKIAVERQIFFLFLFLFFFTCSFSVLGDEGEQFALPSKAIEQKKIEDQKIEPKSDNTGVRDKVHSLLANEKFINALGELRGRAKQSHFLWIEIGFFLSMFFFRAWRQTKSRNWFTKLGVSLVLTLFTWLGVLIVIPALCIGEPFHIILGTLIQVFSV